MKQILLLISVMLWYTGAFAQDIDKVKPLQGKLTTSDSGKISQYDKNKLQLTKAGNSKLPVGLIKVVRNDSVYVFKGDSLIIRRSVADVPHMLEDQVPLQGYLSPDNASPANSSEKNSPKIQKPKKFWQPH
jgi:hypothetical protein